MPRFPLPSLFRRRSSTTAAARLPSNPGAGSAGFESRAADPNREVVSGGRRTGLRMGDLAQVLSQLVDEPERQFGDEITAKMLTDAAVMAPIRHLSLALVEHDLTLSVPGRWQLKPTEQLEEVRRRDPERARHVERAGQVLEFDRRALEHLEQAIEDVILQLGDYPAWGAHLAEIVFKPVDDPILGGAYLSFDAIRPKPRGAWKFVVDARWRVVGILAETDEGSVVYPPEKFLVLSWWPRGGDPRGTRITRPAFTPWNAKTRTYPGHVRYVDRFGTPAVVGYTGPDAGRGPASDGSARATASTADDGIQEEESAEDALLAHLLRWVSGIALALPHGYQVDLKEATGEGRAILGSLAYWDRQIILGIVSSYRAFLESEHGSKADSETSHDVVGLVARVMRRSVARAVAWQALYLLNRLNFGQAEADLYTPECSLGGPEQRDLAGEPSGWVSAGWSLAPEHLAEVDARLGLEPRVAAEEPEPDPEPEAEPEPEPTDEEPEPEREPDEDDDGERE